MELYNSSESRRNLIHLFHDDPLPASEVKRASPRLNRRLGASTAQRSRRHPQAGQHLHTSEAEAEFQASLGAPRTSTRDGSRSENGALIILSSSRSPASSGQLSTSPWPLDRSKNGLLESTHQSGKGIRVDPGVGAAMTWTEALLADEVINLRFQSTAREYQRSAGIQADRY